MRKEKFIVFPNGGIGDSLQLSPIFELIKRNVPFARTTLVGYNPEQNVILEGNPWIDRFMYYNKADGAEINDPFKLFVKVASVVREMNKHDYVIFATNPSDLSDSLGIAAYFVTGRKMILYDKDRSKWLRSHYKDVKGRLFRIYQKEFMRQAGLDDCNHPDLVYALPEIVLKEQEVAVADAFLRRHNIRNLAVVAPDSTLSIKTLPDGVVEDAVAMLKSSGFDPVVLTGKWFYLATGSDRYLHFGSENIKEIAALLSKAAIVITADSGISHIAATLRVPTTTLFGPSSSEWFAPCGVKLFTIEKACPDKVGWCNACTHERYDPERTGAACLHEITRHELLEALNYFFGYA